MFPLQLAALGDGLVAAVVDLSEDLEEFSRRELNLWQGPTAPIWRHVVAEWATCYEPACDARRHRQSGPLDLPAVDSVPGD